MTQPRLDRTAAPASKRPIAPLWQRALPWLITIACFAYLYARVHAQAAREGRSALEFLLAVFSQVPWMHWLALMVPYSAFFFLIDSLVVWRVINWFDARVRYVDILPIRGCAYILSIINEQIGKGAMALYLHRRDRVPGWQVGSSMLFIMFCEFYYLLSWALVGVSIGWDRFPAIFHWIPWIAVAAAGLFAIWTLYFAGVIASRSAVRNRPILHAFRSARPWQYPAIILLRSPALISAVFVYTNALRLFGVEVDYLEMLGYLPVIFFGAATPGPMRAVAILLWVTLFPDHPAQMAAFGLVQHNFFIFFNAAIGLLFLKRANRELLG
jgi:hypothetical protein